MSEKPETGWQKFFLWGKALRAYKFYERDIISGKKWTIILDCYHDGTIAEALILNPASEKLRNC